MLVVLLLTGAGPMMAQQGQAAAAPQPLTLDAAEIIARARPAVVTIFTNDKGQEKGQGSGFIVAPDGIVVTAWHVVAGASDARIKLSNGAYFPVQGLLSWDAEKDFALLKVAGGDLPTLPLGDSDSVRQGDRILTLGSPLGLELTASEGIVSAVRELPDGGKLLQITAPISPGSSGGPVLNARGEAVGIACFVLTEGQSLNFATPVNDAKPKLAARGKVTPLAEAGLPQFAGSAEELYQQGFLALPEDEEAQDVSHKFEAALQLFRGATEKRSDYAEAHNAVGYCLAKLGRFEEALEAFKRALSVKTDYAGAQYNLGLTYASLGRDAEAVEAYKQAIRLKPDYAEAHCDLGAMYLHLGRFEVAVAEFREAIRLKPDYSEAHWHLGYAYLLLGRANEAIAEHREAIRLNPDDPDGHLGLAMSYLRVGDRGRALEEYAILKDLNPDLAAKLFDLLYP